MGFVFILKMFQDECNRDYFQCNKFIVILIIRDCKRAGLK